MLKGDSISILKEFPNDSIDLIVTDPPYKMTKRGKSCRPNWMPNNMGDNVFNGSIPNTNDWMEQCYRVLKEDTHFYTFCNINDITDYLMVARGCGFKLHNIITMIKDTGMPNRWYLKNCELVLFFRKGKAKPINDMSSRDWIRVTMPTQKSGKCHITEKPLDFIQKLVTNSSKENEIVLDCFCGSSTTGVACILSDRRFIGIDMEAKCVEISEQRIRDVINVRSKEF